MSDYKPTRQISGGGGGYSPSEPDYPAYSQPEHYPPPANPGVGYPANKTQVLRRRNEPLAMAWLVIVNGHNQGYMARLDPDATVIGRDPGCQIVLDDPAASRQHVKIRQIEDDDGQKVFVLHDLASENGTLLNGVEAIKSTLSDGDYITIGQTDLAFKQVLPRKKKKQEGEHDA